MTCRTRINRPAETPGVVNFTREADLRKFAHALYNTAWENLSSEQRAEVSKAAAAYRSTAASINVFEGTPFDTAPER